MDPPLLPFVSRLYNNVCLEVFLNLGFMRVRWGSGEGICFVQSATIQRSGMRPPPLRREHRGAPAEASTFTRDENQQVGASSHTLFAFLLHV